MNRLLSLTISLGLSVIWTLAPAGEPAQPPAAPAGEMRNAKLKNLPVNTWTKLCAFQGKTQGAGEVSWCYDSDAKRIVRVGGCTGGYTDEVWSLDVGTETWTNNVKATPQADMPADDHPGRGCNRGICYDPDEKCIWTWGGASSNPKGGIRGLWKGGGDLAPGKWKLVDRSLSGEQALIAYDRGARKLVCFKTYWVDANKGTTRAILVDPKTGAKEEVKPPVPADSALVQAARGKTTGNWGHAGEFPPLVYVPDLKGVLYLGSFPRSWAEAKKDPDAGMVTWLFSCETKTWKDMKPQGSPPWRNAHPASYDSKNHVVLTTCGLSAERVPARETWAYLVKENRWVDMKAAGLPRGGPETDTSMLCAYDQEHDVHVLGIAPGWNKGGVWVYRFGNPPPADATATPPAGK